VPTKRASPTKRESLTRLASLMRLASPTRLASLTKRDHAPAARGSRDASLGWAPNPRSWIGEPSRPQREEGASALGRAAGASLAGGPIRSGAGFVRGADLDAGRAAAQCAETDVVLEANAIGAVDVECPDAFAGRGQKTSPTVGCSAERDVCLAIGAAVAGKDRNLARREPTTSAA
jgi:hypothetical protein